MMNIRRSFSSKLSLVILFLAVPIFIVSLEVLFQQSRSIIRNEAVGRANSALSAAMQRISLNLSSIETATNACSWFAMQNWNPDSLLALTRRIVRTNRHVDGCSISGEPYAFPEYGRYCSVYTIRQGDSITSFFEEEYEYFEQEWYKAPRREGKSCWVDFYTDYASTFEQTLQGMFASYGKPLYTEDGRLIGVISTDLYLTHFTKVIEQEKPYPHSYFMMVDKGGSYFIHPDSTRLFTKSIFTGADPSKQSSLVALGHEMTAGNKGSMFVDIDGVKSLVCYMPVPGTTWSLAVVCPDSDILQGYQKLNFIVIPLFVLGLLVILLISYKAVAHAIRPIGLLLEKTHTIASGNMEVYIPRIKRVDEVGRLQNSFAAMLQALNFHMGSVRYTTEQTRLRNEELAEATRQVEKADRQKMAFLQELSHQIRTPLNIIMGFSQVLAQGNAGLSEEEKKSISGMMSHNSKLLNRMVLMLFDSSDMGLSQELDNQSSDRVACNDVARETIGYVHQRFPDVVINMHSEVPDDFCISTNRLYFLNSLREVLYNAAKYSDGQHVTMRITTHTASNMPSASEKEGNPKSGVVRFVVEDKGKGISEADRERIFEFFTKFDDYSEGLGLGLPLAKRHISILGGDLTIDADYYDGCRFIIELPLA